MSDVYTLANALHDRLGEVWSEANGRDVGEDALLALWDRLEASHAEIGETARCHWHDREVVLAALRDLEVRARRALRGVREGALDTLGQDYDPSAAPPAP